VPTALSSADRLTSAPGRWDDVLRAVADVGPLVRFRTAGLRGHARTIVRVALTVIVVLTVLSAWLPAYLPGAAGSASQLPLTSDEVTLLLPSAYLGVLVISIISAASSGGGRELLPRDQGVAFPVSPTTDHLGALMMAPLNIAWLIQTWTVLAATAYVVGTHHLLAAQLPVVLWLAVATSVAQALAWFVEWVRRGWYGSWVIRGTVVLLIGIGAVLVVTDKVVRLLDNSPTIRVVFAVLDAVDGDWWPWLAAVLVLAASVVVAVVAGALMSRAMAARPARDEMRVESSSHSRRANTGSDLVAMLRTDRVGIWRSVPLRRGFTFLALLPGLVSLASDLEWHMLNILPGLVASGGALLFGVNSWCLDGRGALWRDSLPVSPRLAFLSRVTVLAEVLVVATVLGLALASLRAGTPTVSHVVALACSTVVVTLQVVSASMRWSVRRPYAVDMRSARATPAPPLAMVGYSTRLAVATTFTGMLFVATSRAPDWRWSLVVAAPFVLVSLVRLLRLSAAWVDPVTRSRVVTTVAG
jgi:hypothetical protein